MVLRELHIIGFKNIREADLSFADKLNCFVGFNGQGKTNLLDAIYYLSFTKSAFNPLDSQNIRHEDDFAMIQGIYSQPGVAAAGGSDEDIQITCAIRRGGKKQFRYGKTDYKRLIEHIGRIPLVMVSPEDGQLIAEGSDERRRFMDIVIGQTDRPYLEHLTAYNALLKQRNALLKQYGDSGLSSAGDSGLLEVLEMQMVPHAQYIFDRREAFVRAFVPVFAHLYNTIAEVEEQPRLVYRSQLHDRDLAEAFVRTRQRDLILGWTSQGIHKDELEMYLGDYPLRRVGSQGQQKTYLIAMKLAQAMYLSNSAALQQSNGLTAPALQQSNGLTVPALQQAKPILLLDDIFDKLDAERVSRIINLVRSDAFGQIFLTDTDRQHLTDIVRPIGEFGDDVTPLGSIKVFYVSNGSFQVG